MGFCFSFPLFWMQTKTFLLGSNLKEYHCSFYQKFHTYVLCIEISKSEFYFFVNIYILVLEVNFRYEYRSRIFKVNEFKETLLFFVNEMVTKIFRNRLYDVGSAIRDYFFMLDTFTRKLDWSRLILKNSLWSRPANSARSQNLISYTIHIRTITTHNQSHMILC